MPASSSLRLRRLGAAPALALALLLAWGGAKALWEHRLARGETALRYGAFGSVGSANAGEWNRLGQGALIGLLGGLRAVVANGIWIAIPDAWTDLEWFRVASDIDLATALQPRSVSFWNDGSWYLAWNASQRKLENPLEPSLARRRLDAKFWAKRGEDLLLRGIAANPERYELWLQLGQLRDQRLGDYSGAADAWREAWRRPGAPAYLERFVGYELEKAQRWNDAYAWWAALWRSTADHTDKRRFWDKIALKIAALEDRLKVPDEKRIFPKAKAPQAVRR
ncbi:MAG TPA: hypothetical protein VIM58_04770 [Candidatus Methylacidiphilales bacterium]